MKFPLAIILLALTLPGSQNAMVGSPLQPSPKGGGDQPQGENLTAGQGRIATAEGLKNGFPAIS